MEDNKDAVFKTLAYADIFDYPLTLDELWRYCIADSTLTKKSIQILVRSDTRLGSYAGFYFLKGRESLVNKRKVREEISRDKLFIAKKISALLFFIPTIDLIGISGGLAMKNAALDDDIDLFIITQPGTIWVSRFLVLFVLMFLGKRRKRKDNKVSNMICANMFMTSDALFILNHDLYTAHEVVQMKPLLERDTVYQQFIQQNVWVKTYLPNSISVKEALLQITTYPQTNKIGVRLFCMINPLFKVFQVWYMRSYKTVEVTTDKMLAFHPRDYRKYVVKNLVSRLARTRGH